MNTVQTDTRRRCSNTPSLAALTVAAPPPLTPSRPRPDPPPHNARQRNIGHHRAQPPRHNDIMIQRHVDMPTPIADIMAHTGADRRPAACSLRYTSAPRKMGEAFVTTPHRHKLPALVRAFSLRSGVVLPRLRSSTPRRRCAIGCTPPGDAQPRRYAL